MARVNSVTTDQADPEVKQLLQGIEKKNGKIPNIFKHMANSPAVLKAFLEMSNLTGQTSLSPKLREEIALVVGQTNQCQYCLSAHTAIAKGSGLKDDEIMQARQGQSKDKKEQAILQFAKAIVEKRGHVSQQEVDQLKAAGVNDREITEIVLLVVTNIFTNYFNHVVDTEVDFPAAPMLPL